MNGGETHYRVILSDRIGSGYFMFLVTIHLSMLIYGICVHGPGWDEVGHLPAGLSHWQTGRFDLYRVNPPLVRMVATIPILTQDTQIQWRWDTRYCIYRPEWDLGREFILRNSYKYLTLLRLARLTCLLFAVLGLWVVWKWSSGLFGNAGGMLSITVWAFSPLVITNAQMITPDMAASAFGAAACYSFRGWLRCQTIRNVIFCGLFLGALELTKFTWIILYLVWPLQWALYMAITRKSADKQVSLKTSAGHLAAILGMSLFIVNVGYGFEGTFRPLGSYQFYSSTLNGSKTMVEGNRFAMTPYKHIPVPLPANMIQGIDRQKVDFESGFNSYLRGEWRRGGWWYYYIYGLFVKEPIGFLALTLLTVSSVCIIPITRSGLAEATSLLFSGVSLFVFVSTQTGFNHHIRYVLPSLIFVAIAIGLVVSPQMLHYRKFTFLVLGLAGTGVMGSLWEFPHSHAYFNLLAGGPKNGPFHLLHSNVDWGQDILLLECWAKNNSRLPLDGVAHATANWTGIRDLTTLTRNAVPKAFPKMSPSPYDIDRGEGPRPGRYALSVRAIFEDDWGYSYFQQLTPSEFVGNTYRIYAVNESDANHIRAHYGYPPLPAR